jgi:hypothetical protein
MKTQFLIGTIALLATSLMAADLKDEVKAAAKKLADSGGYAWKTTTEMGGGGGGGGAQRMRPGPTEGKMAKDGTICLSMTRGETTTEAFVKGDKGAIKTSDGWQSLAEANEAAAGGGGGGGGGGRFIARMLQNYKPPCAQTTEVIDKVKDLKKDGDMICGDLTEAGAKSLMTFGRGQGANAPEISDAKGSVKIWLKNGVLSKYEYRVSGKMSFQGNEREMDRTTTVEIKDVGTTKVDVPEEAKKKMS